MRASLVHLVSHPSHNIRSGSDVDDARILTGLREVGPLREEPVAGMDCVHIVLQVFSLSVSAHRRLTLTAVSMIWSMARYAATGGRPLPMRYASSALSLCMDSLSCSENTATDVLFSSVSARNTRIAISPAIRLVHFILFHNPYAGPLFATRTLLNSLVLVCLLPKHRTVLEWSCKSGDRRRMRSEPRGRSRILKVGMKLNELGEKRRNQNGGKIVKTRVDDAINRSRVEEKKITNTARVFVRSADSERWKR